MGEHRQGWQAPGPGHPERLALPSHLRPAAAALFDDLPPAPAVEVVDEARSRLREHSEKLAAQLAPGSEILVDAFRVRAAAMCPASAISDPAVPFSWTPATAARTLGLRAVTYHLRGGSGRAAGALESSVDTVVAELSANGGERTAGPWLAGLTPPARAVVVAHARRWAEQALAWLPLRLIGSPALRFLEDDWWPPRTRAAPADAAREAPAGRVLVVHGRRDITVEVEGCRVAVTVSGGMACGAGLTDVDALTALAGLLCDPRGRLARVVRIHPASGEVVAVDVTAALLARAVDVVSATAGVLASASIGEDPEALPGTGCTWCHRRQVCDAGTAWLGQPRPRYMGLPLLSRAV